MGESKAPVFPDLPLIFILFGRSKPAVSKVKWAKSLPREAYFWLARGSLYTLCVHSRFLFHPDRKGKHPAPTVTTSEDYEGKSSIHSKTWPEEFKHQSVLIASCSAWFAILDCPSLYPYLRLLLHWLVFFSFKENVACLFLFCLKQFFLKVMRFWSKPGCSQTGQLVLLCELKRAF